MIKNKALIIGAVAIIFVGGVAYATMKAPKDKMAEGTAPMAEKQMETDEMKKDEMSKESMMENGMNKEESTTTTMMKKGTYEAYSMEKVAMASKGDVVLFFHASWCPSCRALNADIEKNVSAIPENTTLLKVDYDKETELKKKYGVTTQHTLVQVDASGNLIKKWSGSASLSSVLSEAQ